MKLLKVSDYIDALTNIDLTDIHKRLLINNYNATNYTITATKMARMMGWDNYGAANIHYGHLGKLISNYLNYSTDDSVFLSSIVHFEKPLNEWHWILNQELVQALIELKIVEKKYTVSIPEEIDKNILFPEGLQSKVVVNSSERNSIAREKCINHYGSICFICHTDLSKEYGSVARGFIHVHHVIPLSEINHEYLVDPIKDLRPVCPNCHAIIHLSTPPYSIDEITKMLEVAKKT